MAKYAGLSYTTCANLPAKLHVLNQKGFNTAAIRRSGKNIQKAFPIYLEGFFMIKLLFIF
jgi:hypothetical protein